MVPSLLLLWKLAQFRVKKFCKKDQTFENTLRVYNYYWSLINSMIILPDGNIVIKSDGMPSGVYTTSTDDTFISFIYIVFSYLINGGPPDYDFFFSNFVAALYGDDNCNSYSDTIASWVRGELMARTLNHHFGLTVTGHGLQEWETISFLSHRFIEKNGVMIPMLSDERIICSQLVGSSEPLKSAERCSAFRILAWPYPALYEHLTRYMLALFKEFSFIPKSLLHTDDDVVELYTKLEGFACKSNTLNKKYDKNKITKETCESTATATTTFRSTNPTACSTSKETEALTSTKEEVGSQW